MLYDLGYFALLISFVLAIYAASAAVFGAQSKRTQYIESARNAALIVFPLLTLAVLIVVYGLVTLDFNQAYVADVSSRAMSPFLRVTALWGGQQGSLLFWSWLMSAFASAVMIRKWQRDRELMPYVIFVTMGTLAFFVGLSLFITNPFARLWHDPSTGAIITAVFQPNGAMAFVPKDGEGLNPLLRHFGMIGHPPTTYIGFTGFVIPYAFAIAALITGKAGDDEWIRTTRRWTLVAWLFLSIGLILGGRWAYDVLGWGGYWGWDPVENAMLMPWLTGTAFLHSVMIHEKRGMLKVWNIVLIILTYSLAVFGTFITRTGVIGSVHAFSKSAMGPSFLIFVAVTFLGSLLLLFKQLKTLKAEHELDSLLSRESLFVLQNLLFLGIAFAVFWGTTFPMISELVTGTKITVGPPFFKKVTGPLFAALVLLMGVAPLFAWRKQAAAKLGKSLLIPFIGSVVITVAAAFVHWPRHPYSFALVGLWLVSFAALATLLEFWRGARARMHSQGENFLVAIGHLFSRNRRRYGGYIIHLGVVMMALGVVGDEFFKAETQGTIGVGQSLAVENYTLTFEDVRAYPGSDGREIVEATAKLYRDGEYIMTLKPRRDYFVVQQQPVTVPAVYSTPGEDVYVLLVGWEDISWSASTFKIYVNPLINWVWAGGVTFIIGTLIAAWTSLDDKRAASYVLRPEAPQASPAS
ncbi:MAG TPA: heme lyase CcmF/NrfE family subunit [Anaerolineales bacterium]|nr:heme lyase CcmF/NrfE family subunit [Anaerolineales bacterium]